MSDQGAFFPAALEAFGDRAAVVAASGEQISYRDLAARAQAFAEKLGETRRLVAVEGANTIESLVAYLGALRGRHPVIMTAPDSPILEHLFAQYQPDFRYHQADGIWTLEDHRQAARAFHPDLSLLLSTSGTTGSAKLVRLSAESVQANAASIAEYLRLTPDERPLTSLPMHYSYGLSVVNSHLLAGATLLLTEGSVIEPAFWAFAEAQGGTSLAGVPYTYELLERTGFRHRPPGALKTLTQAGGRLPSDLVVAYGEWARDNHARFYVMYGQTEAGPRMAYLPPEQVLAHPDCIGVPIPGGRFELISETGAEVTEPGTVGELVYHGPNVMLGYAETPQDLARGRDVQFLQTGDLATRTEDGLYRIVGRKSRFAKVFGLRVNLDDVEASIGALGVRGVAFSDDRAIGVALVAPADALAVVEGLAETYKLPAGTFQVWVMDDLPTLPSGKIDYRTLAGRIEHAAPAAADGDGAEGLEQAFVRAFHRTPEPSDSFISLGGDSLNYVILSLEVEERLGFLPTGWEEMTLAELQAMVPRKETGWAIFKPVDSEIVLRALAITAVVTNHVSDLVVGGGAQVLILLAGYNLARYQRKRLFEGRAIEVLTSFLGRIILPYYGLLLVYLAMKRSVDVPALLLVSNYFSRPGSMIEPFWFLEALLQCMAVVTILMSLAPVRRLAARDPWTFGLGLLAVSVAVKAGATSAFGAAHLLNRTGDSAFCMLAFGWCVQQANTRERRLLVSLLAVVFAALDLPQLSFWIELPPPSNIGHALWLAIASLMIVWVPRIQIPKVLHRPMTTVAAASFYIYLTHVLSVEVIYWRLKQTNLLLNLAVAIALGIATWKGFQSLDFGAMPWFRRARPAS